MKRDQAAGLRNAPASQPKPMHAAAAGRRIAILSGKGGVGKTNLVANLAVAAAGLRARVLLIDGDLGLANIDVLLGLVPPYTVADVLDGRCGFDDALVEGPRGIHILPAAAGRPDLAALPEHRMAEFGSILATFSRGYDLVLIDAGAGVGPSVIGLAALCDRAWVITTPEPTSLADAYATLKVLRRRDAALPVEIVVNSARDEIQARATHSRLDRMAKRFLDTSVPFRGYLPHDPRLADAVSRQSAVVELFPTAPSSRQLVALAQGLLCETSQAAPPTDRDRRNRNRGAAPCIRN